MSTVEAVTFGKEFHRFLVHSSNLHEEKEKQDDV